MPRVSYHQNVFDLLDYEPLVSAAALRRIKACERRCGRPLPASLRDWYTTAGVVLLDGDPYGGEAGYLWHEYSNADHAVPLADVLRGFELVHAPRRYGQDLRRDGIRFRTGQRFVRVLIENQAVVRWWVEVNGSDDPPVWVDNESPRLNDWGQVSPTFSAFLFDWFAGYYKQDFTPLSHHYYRTRGRRPDRPPPPKPYLNGLHLRAPREPALLPPHIDYLIDHFDEGPHLAWPKGPTTYRFAVPDARLRVTTDGWRLKGGRSAWWLHADSAEALADLARRAGQVGTLGQALLADTVAARDVLVRLRQEGA
jgi:hypothetical protein